MAAQLCRILFPVDFSNRCMLAARHVKIWADRFGAILSTVHVVDPKGAAVSAVNAKFEWLLSAGSIVLIAGLLSVPILKLGAAADPRHRLQRVPVAAEVALDPPKAKRRSCTTPTNFALGSATSHGKEHIRFGHEVGLSHSDDNQ